MEVYPIHTRLPVVHCGGRHNGLKDMVWVDVLMSVEETHAYVFLLVVPRIFVPLQLQTQQVLTSGENTVHAGTECIVHREYSEISSMARQFVKHYNT